MENFYFSILVFVVIYLLYLFFVILRKKKLEKFKKNAYIQFLVKKYNINLNKVNFKILANMVVITNSFIIASTLFVIDYINNWFLKIGTAVVILVPLQLLMYHIIGMMYKGKKD